MSIVVCIWSPRATFAEGPACRNFCLRRVFGQLNAFDWGYGARNGSADL